MNRAEPMTAQVRLNVPLEQLCRDVMAQRDEYALANSYLWEVVEAARDLVDGPADGKAHEGNRERLRKTLERLGGV